MLFFYIIVAYHTEGKKGDDDKVGEGNDQGWWKRQSSSFILHISPHLFPFNSVNCNITRGAITFLEYEIYLNKNEYFCLKNIYVCWQIKIIMFNYFEIKISFIN